MTQPYQIVFAGTPAIAATVLQTLLDSPHHIVAVYTQPDRPAGRGRKLAASPVKELALEHHCSVHQPTTLRHPDEQKTLAKLKADFIIVVAYGLILPQTILDTPRHGCLNAHVSLLPRFRGAAPIQRAILAGDTETGVSIMQMDAGLDTGDVLYQKKCVIESTDTSQSLHDKLANLSAEALLHTVQHYSELTPQKQNQSMATYAEKIQKSEGKIDWQRSSIDLDRQIRAFNPWPGALAELNGQSLKIWQANVIESKTNATPGTVLKADQDGIDVATGHQCLRITMLQKPGGKRISAQDFLNAQKDFLK